MFESMKNRNHSGDLGIEEAKLKRILKNGYQRMRSGLFWLRIRTNGGLL
jgi:hypothetical protein